MICTYKGSVIVIALNFWFLNVELPKEAESKNVGGDVNESSQKTKM